MEMRLEQREIMTESPCGACSSQATVEGDVTLPGSLRETTHVLYASAMAVVERAEALQDRVSIAGRVVFCVLYTQGNARKVDSIEATADFTHLCDLPGAVPRAEVYAVAQMEHVEATVNGGRMNLRANLRVCASAMKNEQVEVVSSVEAPGAQQQTNRVKLLRTVSRGSGETLLREEFSLPGDLMITDTLGAWASASFREAGGGQGRIGLAGEVTIEAIHASELPGKPLVMTHHAVPVSQSVEISGEGGEMLDGRITVKDVAVASQDMGDGERTLRGEVLLGLSGWAEQEEEINLLTDAYTTNGDELRLTGSPLILRTGNHRIQVAESGKASLRLPEGTKPVRRALAAFANPVMTHHEQQGGRLIAEGILDTTILYVSDEEEPPLSVRMEVPFRTSFAAQASQEDMITLRTSEVEAVPVTSDRAELRYILHADIEGVRSETVAAVREVNAVPAGDTVRDIVLYFVQPGETAWSIARRYRIPESELRSLNPDITGEPKAGQGLVVWNRGAV